MWARRGGRGHVVAAVLLLAHVAQAQVPYIVSKPRRNVCVSSYLTYSVCGINGTLDFSGYEPELFKQVVGSMYSTGNNPEWAPENYSFFCVMFANGLADMEQADPTLRFCDVFLAGVSNTAARSATGMMFTYPTYASGRRIMTHVGPSHSVWSFLRPFSTGVWLLVFAGAVAAGLAVMLLEREWRQQWLGSCLPGGNTRRQQQHDAAAPYGGGHGGHGGSGKVPSSAINGKAPGSGGSGAVQPLSSVSVAAPQPPPAPAPKYSTIQWAATQLTLSAGAFPFAPQSPGGRIATLGAGLVALLIAGSYTAAFAAQIVKAAFEAPITTLADLYAEPVGIFIDDVTEFKQYPLQKVVTYKWDSDADGDLMVQALLRGDVKALILDAPFVDFQTAASCDLVKVGETVLPNSLSFVLPAGTPQGYVVSFDAVLQALDGRGVLDKLFDRYFTPPDNCDMKLRQPTTTQSLEDIGGIWIILAVVIGAALLWQLVAQPLGAAAVHAARAAHAGGAPMVGGADGGGGGISADGVATVRRRQRGSSGSIAGMGSPEEALISLQEGLERVDQGLKHLPYVLDAIIAAKLRSERELMLAEMRAMLTGTPFNAANYMRGAAGSGAGGSSGTARASVDSGGGGAPAAAPALPLPGSAMTTSIRAAQASLLAAGPGTIAVVPVRPTGGMGSRTPSHLHAGQLPPPQGVHKSESARAAEEAAAIAMQAQTEGGTPVDGDPAAAAL
ncbi:hypothetical protein FOA52_001947 [Chlamydomonas sp. UWO 241]|nr:hypothetical protein FOA52_001947 [Chlamydomonas sp. UWO 241]